MVLRAVVFLLFSVAGFAADSFPFAVWHVRPLWRDERGQLDIGASGVSYQSDDGKTSLRIAWEDVREADVADPRVIRIETYDRLKRKGGERRVYTFRLRDGEHGDELARFLSARLSSPVLGTYGTEGAARFTIAAYHRHALGGAHGKIEIGPESIRFVTEKTADSRTWLYRDIQTIGSSDPFHFRLSTYAETYMLDLKERMTREAYDYAWERVYVLERGNIK
jgi:hypothetical protein